MEAFVGNTPKKSESRDMAKASASQLPSQTDFDAVIGLIEAARTKAVAAVNTTLIDLYWSIGEHISRKTAQDGWGKGTVESLSEAIQRRYPGASGYSAANLWRMRQFYEIYRDQPKLAPLVRELSWTHNLLIMSRCKRVEEREFYLRTCQREKWGKRELQRQLSGGLFERTVLCPAKLSPVVAELYPDAASVFKDMCHQRPRGRGIRLEPNGVASLGGRIRNQAARQKTSSSQAPRILPACEGADGRG
jgi:predicted nuclease of restriction endonuclease-like (RecB) superfamily